MYAGSLRNSRNNDILTRKQKTSTGRFLDALPSVNWESYLIVIPYTIPPTHHLTNCLPINRPPTIPMKPTVLFVAELSPCPPYGGELIHTYNLIESLCQHFNVVVLANQVLPDCDLLPKLALTKEGLPAWYNLPRYKTALWAKVYNFRATHKPRPIWVRCLEEIIAEHQPQVAWFNYGHWGQYAPIVQRLGVRAIMGTQNIQSLLTRQRAANTPFGFALSLYAAASMGRKAT